jgi:hypothetical protein
MSAKEPRSTKLTLFAGPVPEPRTVVDTIFAADELKRRTVTVYPIIPPTITWR